MTAKKKTGQELVDEITAMRDYDRDYLTGFLLSLVAGIADRGTVKPPAAAARQVLERLADFDTFTAAHPYAKRDAS
jgi:hypothetical protein